MVKETIILIGAALSIGFFHTLLGPDHYLPFIAISKTRRWNMLKTSCVTLLCGMGHVLSSVILGFIGIGLGITVLKLEIIESFRGELAAWLLLIFGFTYFIWGLRRAICNKPHNHIHQHHDDEIHKHVHVHTKRHTHFHEVNPAPRVYTRGFLWCGVKGHTNITPWVLFLIFVFGPCEPLIPILMYPAAKGNMLSVAIVTTVFGITTIVTMLMLVMIFSYGLARIPLFRLERYSHALAGLVIFICGGAIKFLGHE